MAVVKEYTNGEVTIVWKPDLCIHSENCFHGLPRVFDPNKRPWIDAKGADSNTIVDQIKKCPSGALSFRLEDSEDAKDTNAVLEVVVSGNGPLLVKGDIEIRLPDGSSQSRSGSTALCRCGASGNKPFCDGSHKKIDFKG